MSTRLPVAVPVRGRVRTLLVALMALIAGSAAVQAQPEPGCFTTEHRQVQCAEFTNTNDPGWNLTFDLTNRASFIAVRAAFTGLDGVSVSPESQSFPTGVAPDSTIPVELHLTGSGAVGGDTVRIAIQLCTRLGANIDNCCYDTISVVLPNCASTSDCFQLVEPTVECHQTPNGTSYSWCFNVRNTSGTPRNRFDVMVADATIATFTFDSTLAPGAVSGRLCVPLNGAPNTTLTLTGKLCGYLERDGQRYEDCCQQQIEVRLPDCGVSNDCFELVDQRIECQQAAAGQVYIWCFKVRNHADFVATQIRIPTPDNTLDTHLFANPLQPGGLSDEICVTLPASIGRPGQQVSVGLLLCSDSLRIGANGDTTRIQHCCDGKVELQLPECGGNTGGCFELVNQELGCDSRSGSPVPMYQWCFNVRNHSGFTAGHLSAYSSNPQITIDPTETPLDPAVQPGGLSGRECLRIIGGQPGQIVQVAIVLCDSAGIHCCVDTVSLRLPECGPQGEGDCCDGWQKSFLHLTNSASSSGLTSLWGLMTIGPRPIRKVSATIIEARINGQPVPAEFTNGFIRVQPGTVSHMSEFEWGSNPPANLLAPTLFNFRMRFPPMSFNARRDTLRYCLRLRFTDDNCITCDTVLCFTRVRYRFIGLPGGLINGAPQFDDGKRQPHTSGAEPTLSGTLSPPDRGTIRINFPEPPAELGSVRYVGLAVNAVDVPIVDASATQPGFDFSAQNGSATGTFDARPGDALTLNLQYGALGDRGALEHHIVFRYVSTAMGPDTLEEEVVMLLRREDLAGGDMLTRDTVGNRTVATFAVHLENANGTKEDIHHLVIETSGSMRILAVGPTSDPSRAILEFGQTDQGARPYVGEVVGGQQVIVEPGASHGPIYLTIDGVDQELPEAPIHFMTLNAYGQVITEGDLTISNLSTVERGEVGTGAMVLMQSTPNPTTGAATIEFALPEPATSATLVVTDATGREVARLLDGEAESAGTHAVYLDASRFPAGTYFYTLRADGRTKTKRLTIVR